ncbi:MAG TPA: CHAD domain-containing protein [Hyphomicrobium sp.]|nr:CHAD domain-containing protein [Hyphomicrobium sp.]
MAFRLKLDEPIEKGFRRIGVEQIDRARRQLAARQEPAIEVHEARKCMKRIRALLRLGRIGLGETVYRTENAHFRSIANALSSARDDHVLLETVVKLIASDEGKTASALGRLKEAVLAQRFLEPNGAADGRIDADAALERAVRRFRRLRIEPDSFETLEQGLVRNYRKAIKRRVTAYAENTDDAFHEWRKCVQTHQRHMTLLSRAWPPLFDAHVEAARELSQILGDDHDLAILRQRMSSLPADMLSADDIKEIESLIQARQESLRLAAKPRGDIVFAERPKAHGHRITGIWAGAKAEKREDADTEVAAPPKRTRAKAQARS